MGNKLEICRKALDKFGIVSQMGMMHEEMGELSAALEHYKRGRCKEDEVITEIADVMIVAAQMALYFGKEEVDAEIDRKLEKLEKKLDGEYERYPGMRAAIEEIQRESKRMSDGELKAIGTVFYKHFKGRI
jgi:NTP pyrophosphatase (non-canonical NTP hydrolase)